MDDLISRQMLLEYIHGEPVGRLLCDKYNLDGLIKQFPSAQPEHMCVNLDIQKIAKHKSDFSDLDELPSVQPEVIRCEDCKWCEDADGLMCKNPASWVVATEYDFGCVCAERRQDEQAN